LTTLDIKLHEIDDLNQVIAQQRASAAKQTIATTTTNTTASVAPAVRQFITVPSSSLSNPQSTLLL